MSTLTRKQIASMTGLPASTLSRHLARFPAARAGKGRYDTGDAGLSAWLTDAQVNGRTRQGGQAPTAPRGFSPPPVSSGGLWWLPSGFPNPGRWWFDLTQDDEQAALAALDRIIQDRRLRPHRCVPDLMPFEPLMLPSGTVVNANQWRVLRTGSNNAAGHAMDVLMRSYGQTEGPNGGGRS